LHQGAEDQAKVAVAAVIDPVVGQSFQTRSEAVADIETMVG